MTGPTAKKSFDENTSRLNSGRAEIPALAGTAEADGSLADFIWFRTGGPAEWLVRPASIEDNPFGLYLYVDDVDAVADRVRELIIEPGTPKAREWGCYEFAVSDPSGVLVRIGRIIDAG